jgi:subtilase family serine protease
MVTQPINDKVLHRLAGNTRSQANAQNDVGAAADDFAMEHMFLQLQRPAEQEQAIQQLIESQQDPQSPNYHHWLTAEEIGANFGPAREDIAAVTGWLQSHGFTVNSVYPSGMTIDFSGTAGQVRTAFHTEIHRLNVNGVEHTANMSDPMIPEALAPVVAGVVSMHDFKPRALNKPHTNYTFTADSAAQWAVTPADLATIYNLNPLFAAGTNGTGQTIVVVEDADLYSNADWSTFRSTFGLSAAYPNGTLTTVHPAPSSGTNNCKDPGANSDDIETTLDAEWASAAAPNAAIQVAACADTRTFGGLIAVQNLLTLKTPPAIMSMSYGECEAENGASANAAFNTTFQQAVLQGVSVFVAAGDEGAASCDANESGATHGIGVSGYASTPYNVAVGGTDFGDTYAGSTSSYWNSTNTSTYESAKSYVPEIPWNDSCAGSLLAKFNGSSTVYGSGGFCSSSTSTEDGYQEVVAGSGGPSGCATGSPSTSGVVGGTCAGYAKPSWQKNASGDSVRDIPDVSLFAGNGIWAHFYLFCFSDRRNGGTRCTGAPSGWTGAGGTSFASPIMAGIQALVNQKTGETWGNPNSVYYAMATGSAVCNSSNGSAAGSGCIFYNVTEGDNVVNCSGTTDCYGASTSTSGHGHSHYGNPPSANGALSTSTTTLAPAYGAGTGWNFATGIGSVNAANLVNNWNK